MRFYPEMKQFTYVTLLFLLIAGCKPGVPKDVIQPEEMAEVLQDIHLVDAYVGTLANVDSTKVKAASYYKGVYKKYGIDSALYTKSLNYYQEDPRELDKLYTVILADLNASKTAIVKADSIAGAKIANDIRQKMRRDSTRTADSIYWKTVLLRDTATRKKDIIQPRLIYKYLR